MSLVEFFLLLIAGYAAGVVNAVAGGGTFFTFAAMVALGMSTLEANVTSAVALVPASLASCWAYRRELMDRGRETLPFALIAVVGGTLGAGWLLAMGDAGFRPLVPWLLALATSLFAFSGPIRRAVIAVAESGSAVPKIGAYVVISIVAIYGGLFAAGMGIMLLAALAIIEAGDFHKANMIKHIVALLAQSVAIVLFIAGGLVQWPQGLVAMVAGIVGGYQGVAVARRVPEDVIRWIVVAVGAVLTVVFFLK